MMERFDYIERIHRYLLDEMDDSEKAEFQKAMNQDHALKQDVELEKKILQGFKLVGDEDLRKRIQTVRNDLDQKGFFQQNRLSTSYLPSNAKIIFMKRVFAIAAAAAVLLALGWWFFGKEAAQPDLNAAFAQYFKPETAKVKEMLAEMPTAFAAPDTLRQALQLYDAGNYDQAAATLDTFLLAHPQNDTARFYLAMSHLNATRYAKSAELLTPLTTSETSVFQLDSKWYLGLCYMQIEGGLPKAKEIFAELAANAAYKDRQAAGGILRMIDR